MSLLASPAQNPMMAMNSSCLELHQYARWQEWAAGARRSASSLLDDHLNLEVAERHLYIPLKQAAIAPATFSSSSSSSLDLGDEELVMRVVQFFSNIHANTALQRLMTTFPQEQQQQQYAASAGGNNNNGFASSPAATAATDNNMDDIFLTELGMTPSLVAEQEQIWNQAKNQQQHENAPLIPDWLHQAAQQDGRRIRVVTVDTNTETSTVKCIGCSKLMVAAKNIDVVFCPRCGCTYAIAAYES